MIRSLRFLLLVAVLGAAPAYATPAYLVNADWLAEHIEDDNLVVLEVRYHPHRYFTGGHIPGADAVISMTPSDELAKLEVAALPEAVAEAGLRWFHCPVEDDAAPGPDFEQAWAAHRDAVLALTSQQGGVAIHCRGGSGRTGFMAALILREMGMDGARADALVKGLRPNALTLPAHTDHLAARDGR